MLQQLGHILDLPAAENAIVEQVVLVLVNDFDGLPVDDDHVMAPFLAVEGVVTHDFANQSTESLGLVTNEVDAEKVEVFLFPAVAKMVLFHLEDRVAYGHFDDLTLPMLHREILDLVREKRRM